MERKIGEIFKYIDKWYQCLEEKTCTCFGCDFRGYKCDSVNLQKIKGSCMSGHREDNKPVIFKKLEKVGEPYQYMDGIYQQYKAVLPFFIRDTTYIETANGFAIKTKQIKENMEEKKLNLKPFNLEEAKAGKSVCTRDGRNARIICFDAKDTQPIIGLYEKDIDGMVREYLCSYHMDGRMHDDHDCGYDLMMLPERKEGWVNVYKGGLLDMKSYPSRKEAFDKASPEDYIDTIKINWEE